MTVGFCVVHSLAVVWFLVWLRRAGSWRWEFRTLGLLVVPVAVGLITGVETVRASLEDPVSSVAEYFEGNASPGEQAGEKVVLIHGTFSSSENDCGDD